MYQALLTRRYLTSKVMPLLAAVAVALCTAMVLIVWSVMGGFLNTLLAQGSTTIGDVSVARPVVGFPYYEEFIDELVARPEIAGATPTIEAMGLLGLPNGETRVVTVTGVYPQQLDAITSYSSNLWWRPVEAEGPPPTEDQVGVIGGAIEDEPDWRAVVDYAPLMSTFLQEGSTLRETDPETGIAEDAMVVGIEVTGFNQRRDDGTYVPARSFVPQDRYTIGVLPMSRAGVAIQVEYASMPVANEYRSGMYQADENWVFVPFDRLQRMLKLDAARRVPEGFTPGETYIDDDGVERIALPTATEITPARATHILVRAAEGVTAREAEAVCEAVYADFATRHDGWPTWERWDELYVYVWEDKPGLKAFIAAVRKETGLVLVLFVFISFTAVFLVGAIFWAMVSEKTKDIGVLRAVGAGRAGVAWLFVRYGLAIGVVGSVVGGIIAWLIITNINPIHEWLGRALGLYIWDPSVYYFTEIPSELDPMKVLIVLGGGVLFSALGALIPAARAAWMHPVKALRFE